MAEQTIPEYETIRAAVAGETWAVEKVLMCYKDEIDRQATVKKRQPDGTFKLEIDEDMRQYITMKLRCCRGNMGGGKGAYVLQGRNRQAGNCKETSAGRNIQTGN